MPPTLTLSPLQARQCDISPGIAFFASTKGKERARDIDDDDGLNDAAIGGERGPPALLETLRSISRKKSTARQSRDERVQTERYVPKPALDKHGKLLARTEEPPDELAWKGDTLVWSKGDCAFRQYSYRHPSEASTSKAGASQSSGRVIQQALFAYFEVPAPGTTSHSDSQPAASTSAKPDVSLFGPFQEDMPPAWSDDNANASATRAASSGLTSTRTVRVLCVRFWDEVYLYFPDGAQYVIPLDFPVERAWALDRGLLLEKAAGPASSRLPWQHQAITSPEQTHPAFYVLLDPFESVKPVAKAYSLAGIPEAFVADRQQTRHCVKVQDKIRPFLDHHERVIFTSGSRVDGSEPIIVSINQATGKLSVWAYSQVPQSAKLQYDDFKTRIIEQELAEAELNGTLREDTESARLPSAIGKRRRSEHSAMANGPNGQQTASTAAAVAVASQGGAQSAAQRRVSALLDRRKSAVNPNASVADFLEAMGTNTRDLNPAASSASLTNGQTQGPEQALRRASSAYMDRRHSAIRTELSVSLNRMALGNQRKASLPGPLAAAAAEAMLAGEEAIPQPGHGEIERETSFVVDEHREQREKTDFFITRLASTSLSESGAQADFQAMTNGASAAIFDVRDGSSTLAVCVPSLKTLCLFRISRERVTNSVDSKITCVPLRQLDAVSIVSLYATRHAQQDLLLLDSQGKLSLLVESGSAIALDLRQLDLPEGGKAVSLDSAGTTQATLSYTSNGALRRLRLDLDFRLRATAAIDIFDVLAYVLPTKALVSALIRFSDGRRAGKQVSSALHDAFFPPDSSHDMDNDSNLSPWEALLVSEGKSNTTASSDQCTLPAHLAEVVLVGIYLLSQDWSLLSSRQKDCDALRSLLSSVAAYLGMADFQDAVARQSGASTLPTVRAPPQDFVRRAPAPFDLHVALRTRLVRFDPTSPIQALDDLVASYGIESSHLFGRRRPLATLRQVLQIYDLWHAPAEAQKPGNTPAERIVLQCATFGWTPDDITELATGPAMPIREAIRQCQLKTPELWPKEAYVLLGRYDQTVLLSSKQKKKESTNAKKRTVYSLDQVCDPFRTFKPMSHQSHQTKRKTKDRAARFSQDSRLEDVGKMLNYTVPCVCKLPGEVSLTDATLPEVQQKYLLALASRTLSIPIGSGAFMYRALARPRSVGIPIPKVELSARLLPSPGVVNTSPETVLPEEKIWPYFHSGVAVALHIAWAENDFDSSEFALHKPSELNARHAGFLLGLGLTGQARSLGAFQAFKYMDPKHEYTSVGLLLGLGAAYRGTTDPKISSALSVHISALHPPSAGQLNLSHVIQSSALVGIGLVHIGTKNRKIADNVLRDLSRTFLLKTEHQDSCRDGYALASGICYGLVMLGKGDEDTGPSDAETLRTFRNLLEGGRTHSLPGSRKTFDGVVDVAVTGPAAAIALGLSFMRTNRQDVADMLEIPQAADRLDHVRSDLIALRTMCRQLIMWDSISCKREWVESVVPAFIQTAIAVKVKTGQAMPYDYELAYWNTVTGACMAIGLKYAGTAKEDAHGTLIWYLDRLIRVHAGTTVTASLRTKLSKHSLQNCINTIVLAFGSVMAGTGELNLLRRLRVMHGQVSEGSNYGTHMASHLALGLLFLGKGRQTLGTSKLATAALVCAFYPSYPTSSTCNRFHLQAFRHLWVLAVEPRCLVAKDIDSQRPVYIPLKFRVKEEVAPGQLETRSKKLTTPTLIPPLETIESIKTDSPRYWPINLNFAASKAHLQSFLHNQTIFVKRKAGHLSYSQDPRGIRSIFTQAKIEAGSTVFDAGDTANLLTMALAGGGLSQLSTTYSTLSGSAKADLAYFCTSDEASLASSQKLASFLSSVALECLLQDKQEVVHVYRTLYAAAQLLEQEGLGICNLHALRDLLLVCDLYQDEVFDALLVQSGGRRLPLITRAFVDTLQTLVSSAIDRSLEAADLPGALKAYLEAPTEPSEAPSEVPAALSRTLLLLQAPALETLVQLRELVAQSKVAWTGSEEDFAQLMLAALEKMLQALARQTGGVHVDRRLPRLSLDAWL